MLSSSALTSDSSEPFHHALIALAAQITPLMQGQIGSAPLLLSAGSMVRDTEVADQQGALFLALYQYWQQQHPEAGHIYWLTRSWSMLSWQPIYLSLLSVYGIQAAPSLHNLGQTLHLAQGLVAGFSLASDPVKRGSPAMLIPIVADELWRLLSQLQQQFNQVIRLRPGFVKALLADDLVTYALKVQHLRSDLSHRDIIEQISIWHRALRLPAITTCDFFVAQGSQTLDFMRTSCCMHYRRHDGDYCANCPKADKLPRGVST